MGCSMIDDVRAVPLHHLTHSGFVTHGAYDDLQDQIRVMPFKLLLYAVDVVLIYVEEDQAAGSV